MKERRAYRESIVVMALPLSSVEAPGLQPGGTGESKECGFSR